MRYKTCICLLFLLVAAPSVLCARTWRPAGQTPISGDFVDVVGSKVKVRTAEGIKTLSYADLSTTDKAVVKSNLQSLGRTNEALKLDAAAADPSQEIPSGDMSSDHSDGDRGRTWTDIVGNKLVAEYVGVKGTDVYLRHAGEVSAYPINGFSTADQDWIEANRGADLDLSGPGSSYPGSMPPDPSMNPGRPPEMGSDGRGFMPPPFPDITMPEISIPQMPDPANFPRPSFPDAAQQAARPDWGTDKMFEGSMLPNMASGSTFEWQYKCMHCNSVFNKSDGYKSGDPCPKCSPWASRRSRGGNSDFAGGLAVGVGVLIVLCMTVGGAMWLVRQITG